jgi:hypothetical protein
MRGVLIGTLWLLLGIAPCRSDWIPPWYTVMLGGSVSDNVFADSASTGDEFTSLGLDRAQPLSGNLLGMYSGGLESYRDNGSLGLHTHDLGLDWFAVPSGFDELWAFGGFNWTQYREGFALYNRRSGYLDAGVSAPLRRGLQGRMITSLSRTFYPESPDTLNVNYDDVAVTAGLNVAFPFPLALDSELGYEARRYFDMDDPRTTEFIVWSTRVSGPIDPRTGASASFTLRSQTDPGQENLIALYRAGVDPRTLLWDGWSTGFTLNHIIEAWKLSFDFLYGEYDFSEALPLDFLVSREDLRHDILFTAERDLPWTLPWMQPSFVFTYQYVLNQSTYELYEYTVNAFTFTLVVEPN